MSENDRKDAEKGMNHPNKARRNEIMINLFKQGDKLVKEGQMTGDKNVMGTGKLLILLSGLVNLEEKMDKFNEVVGLFTAKEMLENIMHDPVIGPLIMLKGSTKDPEELLKRIMNESGDNNEEKSE